MRVQALANPNEEYKALKKMSHKALADGRDAMLKDDNKKVSGQAHFLPSFFTQQCFFLLKKGQQQLCVCVPDAVHVRLDLEKPAAEAGR